MPPPISRTFSAPPAPQAAHQVVEVNLTRNVPEPAVRERGSTPGQPRLGLSEARLAYYQILDRLQARQRHRLGQGSTTLGFDLGAMELLAPLPRPAPPSGSGATDAAPIVVAANTPLNNVPGEVAQQLSLAMGMPLTNAPGTEAQVGSSRIGLVLARARAATVTAASSATPTPPRLSHAANALSAAVADPCGGVGLAPTDPASLAPPSANLWDAGAFMPWLETPAVAPATGLDEPDVLALGLPATPPKVEPGGQGTLPTRPLAANDVMDRYDVAQLRRPERQLHGAIERAEAAEVPPQLYRLLHPSGTAEHWTALPELELPEHCTGEAPLRRLGPFDVADKLMRGEHEGRKFLCVRFFDLFRRQSGLVVLAQIAPYQRGTQDWMVINPQHFGPLSAPHQHLEPHLLGLSYRHPERLPNAPAARHMFAALRTLVQTGAYLGRSKFVLRARLLAPAEGWATNKTVRSTPTDHEISGPTADDLARTSDDLRAASPARGPATPPAAAAGSTPSLLLTTPPASPPASPQAPREGARAPTPEAGQGAASTTEVDVGETSDAVFSPSSVAELSPPPAWMQSSLNGAAPRGRRESDAQSGDDPVPRPRPQPRNVRPAAPPTSRGKRAPNVPRRPLGTAPTSPGAPRDARGTNGAFPATGRPASATAGPRAIRDVGASSTSRRMDLGRPQRAHRAEKAPGPATPPATQPVVPVPRAAGPARNGALWPQASATSRSIVGSPTSGAARAPSGASAAPAAAGPTRVRGLAQPTNAAQVTSPAPGRTHRPLPGSMSGATARAKGSNGAEAGAPHPRAVAHRSPPPRAPLASGRAAAAGPAAAVAAPADQRRPGAGRAAPTAPRFV